MQAKAAPAKWCWAWHRGRLNVLVNVLGKKPQDLFDEFAGKHKEHLGTGDVKYHMGFSSDMETEGGLRCTWRWRLTCRTSRSSARWLSVPYAPVWIVWTSQAATKFLPITIHGDAAVTGQGVVQGNSEHVQSPRLRSGRYQCASLSTTRWASRPLTRWMRAQRRDCTDIGKMVQAPIFARQCGTIRKRSPSSPVWRLISAIPLNAMSSLTGVLPPSRPQRSR